MAEDKESQDAAMARARAQADEMKSQTPEAQGVKQADTQISAAPPTQNPQAQREATEALSQGQTLDDKGEWANSSVAVGNNPQEIGQTLQNNGATAQDAGYNGELVTPTSVTSSQSVNAIGQDLQKNGVTTQEAPLSQEKAAHLENTLDNSEKGSGNQPSQGKENVRAVQESAKDAETSQPSEPDMDR